MQVNPLATVGLCPQEGGAAALVLPTILPLLEMNAGPQTRRAQALGDRMVRLRRRDADHQQALAQASQAPRVSEEIVRAERKMLSGSQAARRRQGELRQGRPTGPEQAGFREALASARIRPPEGKTPVVTTEPAARPAGKPTDQASQPAAVHVAGDGARPNGSGAAEPPSPATSPTVPNSSTVTAHGARPVGVALAPAGNAARLGVEKALQAGTTTARVAATSAVARDGPAILGRANPAGTQTSLSAPTGARVSRFAGKAPGGAETAGEPEAKRTSDANTARILRTIHFRLGEKRSVATLRMDPPELGKIKLHMDLRDEQLSLRIEAESAAARRLLAEQLDALRHGLEASGLRLDRCEIRVPQAAPGDGNANLPQHPDVPYGGQQESAQRDTHSAGGGSQSGTEAPTVEQTRSDAGQTVLEPATESLVNVWA